MPQRNVEFGAKVRFTVGVKLDKLAPEDVVVELMLATALKDLAAQHPPESYAFKPEGARDAEGEQRFTLDLAPELCGKLEFRIRAYPNHPALSHRFEVVGQEVHGSSPMNAGVAIRSRKAASR